jgi:hypothetical protein
VLGQQRFELGRRYMEAVHLDQLPEPVDDGDRAGDVDAAEVAGVQPERPWGRSQNRQRCMQRLVDLVRRRPSSRVA